MTAVAVACLPIFFTHHLIARWEGGLFLAYFFAYNLYIVLAATGWTHTRSYGVLMLVFVIPLTAVTLAISAIRAFEDRRRPQDA
jgi:cation:H+ antiporter